MPYTKRKTLSEMEPVLVRWYASNLSKTSFCRQECLQVHTLNYWLERYGNTCANKMTTANRGDFIKITNKPSASPKLTKQVFDNVATNTDSLMILLPNGVQISGCSQLNAKLLNILSNV